MQKPSTTSLHQWISILDPAIRHAACFGCFVDCVLVMLSLVFDLSMRLRINSSLIANASVGANGHVIKSVARATMEAFCLLSTRSVSSAPSLKD